MIRVDFTPKEKMLSADLNAAFGNIKGSTTGTELHQFNETPAYAGTAGNFRTAFPYRPKTLQVYMGTGTANQGMRRHVKVVDYVETSDPTTSQPTLFTFIAGAGAAATSATVSGSEIRVDYQRADL